MLRQAQRTSVPGILVGVGLFLASGPGWAVLAVAADPAPVLIRYGWEANQPYAYRVEIQADNQEYKEFLSGTPVITVKSASKDGTQVQISGEQLASRRETKRGEFPALRPPRIAPFPRIGGPGSSGHELTLDARGRVVKERGQSSIPYLLGDLREQLVPQFPDQAEQTWKTNRELTIRVTQQGRIPSPFRDEVELKRMNAEETVEYTLASADEKSATINRKYSLKTVEAIDGEPALEVLGEGQIVFDRVRKVVAKIEYTGKVVQREENSVFKVPVKVSIALLSAEEQQKLQAEQQAKLAALKAPPTEQERADILENLKATDFGKWFRAVQMLKQKQPAATDTEIAAALAGQIATTDNSRRFQLAQALETWATDKEVPTLISLLDDDFQPVAGAAMNALARLKAPEAIEPLAQQLEKLASRISASKALKEIGPPAEAAVTKVLGSAEWSVRLEAVMILAEIGTSRSIEILEIKALKDENALVKQRAKDALEKIRKREPKP